VEPPPPPVARPASLRGDGPVWTLGLGAFGLAFALTVTAAYLPPLLGRYTDSTTLIALVLAAEGAFALALPTVVGSWSDTFQTPLGRRRPFMLVAIGPMAFCLALIAFMPSFWTTAMLVFAFFFAYYVYEPPYRGLYPDVVPEDRYGRSQSVQHLLRGVALGSALVGGGLLFDLWEPGPFLVAAAVTAVAASVPVAFVQEVGGSERVFKGVGSYLATSRDLFRSDGRVRRFLIANAAWEGAFAAARTFVVLYIVVGLGQPPRIASLVLGAVAGGYVVAALVAGRLGERFGLARVIYLASFVYAAGLLAGGLAESWSAWYLPAVFGVAIAAGLVMTLAWGLLYTLMPGDARGTASGLATATKGVGLIVGPLLAGGAIDLSAPLLESTSGYRVLWPVCAIPVVLAIPLVRSLRRAELSGTPERPAG
jgi:MFS family permease